MSGADLVNAFDAARIPLVQFLRANGPIEMNGPGGTTHVFMASNAPLELELVVARPATAVGVPTTATSATPSPNATPPTAPG
jgi:hypothetical protein